MHAPLFAVGYLAYSYYASRNARGRINHDAHLAGALAGVVFVGLFDPSRFEQARTDSSPKSSAPDTSLIVNTLHNNQEQYDQPDVHPLCSRF
jgi:hypothetical protein